MRVYFDNPPEDVIKSIDQQELQMLSVLQGEFDYIHLFVKTLAEFHERFPKLKGHLAATGMLWLSWPKAGKSGTDLSLPGVIKAGYDYGLVESKTISINDTWSAIKFTHPKKGKKYNNSYGQLKSL
jgi:hypothetical protein